MKIIAELKVMNNKELSGRGFEQDEEKGTVNNPYTVAEYETMLGEGTWAGGFVENLGFAEGENNDDSSYMIYVYFYDGDDLQILPIDIRKLGISYDKDGNLIVENGGCTLGAFYNALHYFGLTTQWGVTELMNLLYRYWIPQKGFCFDSINNEMDQLLSNCFITQATNDIKEVKQALKQGSLAYIHYIDSEEEGTVNYHDVTVKKRDGYGYTIVDPVTGSRFAYSDEIEDMMNLGTTYSLNMKQ